MWVRLLDWEDPLEQGLATLSSILAWRIPWTEEPGGLWSIGSQRVRHDWSDLAYTHACARYYRTKSQSTMHLFVCIHIKLDKWFTSGAGSESASGKDVQQGLLFHNIWTFLNWKCTNGEIKLHLSVSQALGPGALGRARGIGWRGRWDGGSGWGTHVNPWLIHFSVWQNPLQYCKIISLQLIKK